MIVHNKPRGRWLVAVALGLVLASIAPVDEAAAKRKRSRLAAQVNGRRFNVVKRTVVGTYTTTGISVGGAAKPRRRVIRQVTLTCGIIDLATATLPVTFDCYASYTESATNATPFKQWASYGVLVTIDSYAEARVAGTFRGTIQPATDPAEPVTAIENGRFSVQLIDLGV
jgi:hypothetical protein